MTLHRLGRDAEALQLAQEELALARQWGAPRTIGISLRALGLVQGGPEGLALLGEAVAVLQGSQAQLEQARAPVDLGAALRRANRRGEAQAPLRQGLELAHRAGARGLVRRAQEELAVTGARPRKLLLTGVDVLTASERRVARMAAEGMSNKEPPKPCSSRSRPWRSTSAASTASCRSAPAPSWLRHSPGVAPSPPSPPDLSGGHPDASPRGTALAARTRADTRGRP